MSNVPNDSPMYNRWQDQALLEGPQTRRRDLALILRSVQDFISGFRALHFVGPCVTVFGSARFNEGHEYYELGPSCWQRAESTRLHGDDRRWARADGSRQPRRQRGGWALGGVLDQVVRRGTDEPVSGSLGGGALLLRA